MAEIHQFRLRVRAHRPAGRQTGIFGFAGIAVFAFFASAAGFGWLFGAFDELAPRRASISGNGAVSVNFPICVNGQGRTCIIDGDTFRLDNVRYRIADIDTPEVRDYGCAAEKALGDRATRRMRELLNAGPFEIAGYSRDEDQYGRKLRIVRRDGQSLGMILVREGLARQWDGARRNWC